MTARYDLVVHGGTIVNQDGRFEGAIGVSDGRIAGIGAIDPGHADRSIDATGLHVLPGVIDTQVHFREPGGEHKEDLHTGSRAAVAGGVTAVFEMPNTNPLTTSRERFEDKIARATGRMHCDFAFYVGGTAENVYDLPELERLPGAAGVKVFMGASTGTLLVDDDATLRRILSVISRRAAFHAEDEPRLRERASLRVPGDPSSHPVWRDDEAAMLATRRLVAAAREFGSRIHVLHISTAQEMQYLADHKDVATVEATPQHLTLEGPDAYRRLGTLAQMNPPVRDAAHRAGIWWGLEQGVVDVIGSDHAPHTHSEKQVDYPSSPSGMPGVQTLVPVMLTHVNAGRLTLERFVDLTSHGPSRIFQIARKGRIAVGYDADLTLVDLDRRQTVEAGWLQSKAGWSPFEGDEMHGWPVGTIVRGHEVMRDGEILGEPAGRPVHFTESLPAGTGAG